MYYTSKVARMILEKGSGFSVSNNATYNSQYDHIKTEIVQWVLEKRPEAGFADVNELMSTFNSVLATIIELESEADKYREKRGCILYNTR